MFNVYLFRNISFVKIIFFFLNELQDARLDVTVYRVFHLYESISDTNVTNVWSLVSLHWGLIPHHLS